MTLHGEWRETYQQVEIPGNFDRIPDYDPRAGEHLWTVLTMFRWGGPGVEQPILDSENLLTVQGPGCYYCEEVYTPRLATRRCPGRPRH